MSDITKQRDTQTSHTTDPQHEPLDTKRAYQTGPWLGWAPSPVALIIPNDKEPPHAT